MLLICEQCGFLDHKMLKLPSTLFTVEGNTITFETSSKESYVNLCIHCLGMNNEKESTTE